MRLFTIVIDDYEQQKSRRNERRESRKEGSQEIKSQHAAFVMAEITVSLQGKNGGFNLKYDSDILPFEKRKYCGMELKKIIGMENGTHQIENDEEYTIHSISVAGEIKNEIKIPD